MCSKAARRCASMTLEVVYEREYCMVLHGGAIQDFGRALNGNRWSKALHGLSRPLFFGEAVPLGLRPHSPPIQ